MNLAGSFVALSASRILLPPDTFVVEGVAAPQETYIACTQDGRPAIFIAVEGDDSPGIKLRNMEMRHRTRGDLRTPDGSAITGTYTLIECLSNDARLHQAFLELASDVLKRETPWANTLELEQGFTSLVELFRAVSMPSPSSWMGAWGEFFLMHAAPSAEALLACWHVDPMKLHDFALGIERLECKTTGGQARIHDFSLDQLDESERTIFIASIVTHETLGGVSALALYDEIRRRVRSPELRVHLDTIVALMLGENLDSAAAPRFDYGEAQQSLRVFAGSSIPAPTNPSPNQIDSVRFRSNLVDCQAVALDTPLLRLL